MVLRKKETYTVITPIPGFIPRQLAIDILHSHSEVITLNPLVLGHKQISPPRNAPSDEYYSTWYEITERVQIVPGMGKLGSGKITFNGVFHDLPWGLQTHIYGTAGVDLRNKYRIGGNQPGIEPPEQQEIGLGSLGAPKDGLYLREDIEIRCNFTLMAFVKSTLQKASKDMVDRIIKKAELLDAGVLQAMIEDGKLKTMNPANRAYTGGLAGAPQFSPPHSPGSSYSGSQPPASPSVPYQVPRPVSLQPPPSQHQYSRPQSAGSHRFSLANTPDHTKGQQFVAELPSQEVVDHSVIMELPGDMYHAQGSPNMQPPQPSPHSIHPNSAISDQSARNSQNANDWRWSQSQNSPSFQNSRPTSLSSEAYSAGMQSPGLEQKGFTSGLAPHQETHEEYRPQSQPQNKAAHPPYNPADYARVGR